MKLEYNCLFFDIMYNFYSARPNMTSLFKDSTTIIDIMLLQDSMEILMTNSQNKFFDLNLLPKELL